MEPCYILIPRHDIFLAPHDTFGCINKKAHLDEHINILNDGRIIKWETELCHGCTDCDPAEVDCFVYNEISKSEALTILENAYGKDLPEEIVERINQLR